MIVPEDRIRELVEQSVTAQVVSWLNSKFDTYEYRYYLAQREGDYDNVSRIVIEFANEVRRQISATTEQAIRPLVESDSQEP